MQTIQSRLYFNVILTVIAILLAIVAFRPFLKVSSPAFAEERSSPQRERLKELEGAQFDAFAAATHSVADANRDIAKAIREAAKSQSDIAKAIGRLGDK